MQTLSLLNYIQLLCFQSIGLSKSQISEELGTKNLNDKEAYVSIGAIIRLGAKSHLKLGMLLSFFGFELDPYMSMYENYMLQVNV